MKKYVRGYVSLKKYKSQGKAVGRADCEQQGGKLLRLLSEFCTRIRPQDSDLERGGGELASALYILYIYFTADPGIFI